MRTAWFWGLLLLPGAVLAAGLVGQGVDRHSRPAAALRVVHVADPDLLGAMGRDARSLNYRCRAPGDLKMLSEFADLQRLTLRMVEDLATWDRAAWSEAGADALKPLLGCRGLEELRLEVLPGLEPHSLLAVQSLPKLRMLDLVGPAHLVDADLADVLAKLALRELRLVGVRFTPEGFARLCRLPVLQNLAVESPLHIGSCDVAQLRNLRQLRRLALRGWGQPSLARLEQKFFLPIDQQRAVAGASPAPIGPELAKVFAQLPALRELDLVRSVIREEVLGMLPQGLERLALHHCIGATSNGIRQLARLPKLRVLSLHTQPNKPAVDQVAQRGPRALQEGLVDLLHELPLERLDLVSGVTLPLAAAIAKCESLREVSLRWVDGAPMKTTWVRSLPNLERLQLYGFRRMDLAGVEASRSLRELVLYHPNAEFESALRRACGKRLRIVRR